MEPDGLLYKERISMHMIQRAAREFAHQAAFLRSKACQMHMREKDT